MNVLRLILAVCVCGTLGCATGLMEPVVEQSGLRILSAASQGLSPAKRQQPPRTESLEALASDEPEEPVALAAATDDSDDSEPSVGEPEGSEPAIEDSQPQELAPEMPADDVEETDTFAGPDAESLQAQPAKAEAA